jgi:DHA1 family bicyclomycin/chloramphenicol resistance-like MFS transporter
MTAHSDARLPLSSGEFITLIAWLMAMTALSIDIMLPSLTDIARTFSVASDNDRQLIVSTYLGGMALGQLSWGYLSDRWGRRLPLLLGLLIYCICSLGALLAPSFQALIVARAIQGFGGAAARTIGIAVVRDVFAGREMARTMSFVMMVFITVPMLAPAAGQGLLHLGDWRWPFGALLGAGVIAFCWVGLRLPETWHVASGGLKVRLGVCASFRAVLGNPTTRGYGLAAGLMFGCLVSYISSAQQIFVDLYGLGDLFPLAFGSIAASMAVAAFTNSQLVQRIGMRRLSHMALVAFVFVSGTLAVVCLSGNPPVLVTIGFFAACFYLFAVMQANFNAIAMHPVGHAAGMASSLFGAFVTACGVALGGTIGRNFDGSLLPIAVGFAVLGSCAFIVVLLVEGTRGMFKGE